jgi:ATP-binding cassette subfamily C protein CydC
MKRSFQEIRPFLPPFARHLKAMALGTGFGILAAAAVIGLLGLSGWFITAAALAGATAAGAAGFNFFFPSIGVRIFAVGRTLARYAERVFSHDATFRILSDLRTVFYRRLEPIAPAGLLRFQSGDILQRVVGDIDTLDHLYLRLVSPCAVAAFVVAGVVGFIAAIDAAVGAVAAAFLLAGAVGVSALSAWLGGGAGRAMNVAVGRLRVRVVEGILCIGELLACGAHRRYLEKMDRDRLDLISTQRAMSRLGALAVALVSTASGLGALAVVWLACQGVVENRLDPAEAALVVFMLIAAFEFVLPLAAAFQFLGRTGAAARRLSDVLDPVDRPPGFPSDRRACPARFDLRFEAVDFRYRQGREPVLDGFTLHMPAGRRLALLGPTGAGKSTLVHLLCRFWAPDRGRIFVGDSNIAELAEKTLRQTLAVVSQRDHIFSATVRENLSLGCPGATDEQLRRALQVVGLERFVRDLPRGLDTWVGEGGRGVSGGQARRIFVARAVLQDAPIWVLDEPTEGIDRDTETAVFEALFSLTAGRTVLVITHRPVLLDRFDQAAVMERGRIVETGTHRDLLAAGGRYAQLVSMQNPELRTQNTEFRTQDSE